jgi:hypothetical protein
MTFRLLALASACLLLAGCSSPSTEATPSSTATPSASPTRPPSTMPDIAGKTYAEARDLLGAAGISFDTVGAEGRFTTAPPASAIVVKADLAAGEKVPFGTRISIHMAKTQPVLEAEAAAEKAAAQRAIRYTFNCSTGSSAIGDKTRPPVHTFKEIWADPAFALLRSCDGRVGLTWWHDRYALEPDEKAVVDQLAADGGDASSPSGAYSDVLAACLITPSINWDTSKGLKVRVQAVAKAALKMCPDASFAAELSRVAAGEPKARMEDGSYAVGTDVAAGTYQVQIPAGANGVHDCYWERSGTQGGIIANKFINYAPQAPEVTMYAGEGFTSKRCGTWQKVG